MPGTILFQPTEGKPRTVKGELVDVSFRGVAAYSDESLPKDALFRFLLLSKEFDVRMGGVGKIIYSQPIVRRNATMFRLAVEFTSVDSDLVREIMTKLEKVLEPKEPNQP